MRGRAATLVAAAAAAAAVLLGATPASSASSAPLLPPPGAAWDYQIGGPRPVPTGVQVVVRDRRASPAGDYPVCYVNAFQTQPDEKRAWSSAARRDLVLTDTSGRRVADSAWGEWLLDIGSADRRERLAAVVGRWTQRCAADGFVAVEYDNLDSWTRSGGLLTRRDATAYARLLVAQAHEAGLAVAQKNTAELLGRARSIGFDLAVVESCAAYDECARFTAVWGDRTFVVEYDARSFRRACREIGAVTSVVLRDLDVSPAGPDRRC